jgi:hypothetical protein
MATSTPVLAAPTIQPKLVIPLGRGARGKTFWLRWAIERAQSQGRDIVVADADRTNATLSAFFDGVVTPPSADDRDVKEFLAQFIEQQIEQKFSVQFLLQHGVTPVAIHCVGPDVDDLAYLQEVEQSCIFVPDATVLIMNEATVPAHRTPLSAFENSVRNHPILTKVVQRGGKLVRMPRLEPAGDIDTRRLTFAAAEEGRAKGGQQVLGPWKRQQVAIWRRAMEESFASVANWLP